MTRNRLDVLLFERGLAESREKARAMIIAGEVLVDNQKVDKPGHKVDEDVDITVIKDEKRYASRGGTKLEGAIKALNISFKAKVVLDVGASTGGFTDCALKHGATRVYAVDVGYGQLDWRLRQDPRVKVMERTNIRYVTPEQFPEKMDMAIIDVSFISLGIVLPAIAGLLSENAEVIALVKPQFEAGRGQVGKKGVVRDPAVHTAVLQKVAEQAQMSGLSVVDACYSPIKGPSGNIEFFFYLSNSGERQLSDDELEMVVNRAHNELRG